MAHDDIISELPMRNTWSGATRTARLPGVRKDHNNRIYDNLTEMQPWIYSYKKDQDESFKNDLLNIFRTNQTKQITEQI